MFFKRSLIAIDIGTSAVKIMETSGSDTKRRLTTVGVEILPVGAVQDGELRDPAAVGKTVAGLLDRLGIETKKRRVALSVSGNAVIIKRVTFVPDEEIDLGEQLFEEAKQHFHHDMEDMYFRFQIIESRFTQHEENAAIIVAAKIGVIEQYVQMVHDLGMKVGVIDCDILSLANMFQFNYPIEDSLVVLVNIGAASTQILVTYNGEFLFNREIYVGGQQVTAKLAEGMGVDLENAESIKLSASSGDSTLIEQVRPVIRETVHAITQEIAATVEFFLQSDEFPDEIKQVDSIYLTGGGAQTLDLAESVSAHLKAPVQIVNPFQRIETDSVGEEMEVLLSQGPLYGVVLGLSFRQLNDGD
jgi:type IV pilus assembly protein PilM